MFNLLASSIDSSLLAQAIGFTIGILIFGALACFIAYKKKSYKVMRYAILAAANGLAVYWLGLLLGLITVAVSWLVFFLIRYIDKLEKASTKVIGFNEPVNHPVEDVKIVQNRTPRSVPDNEPISNKALYVGASIVFAFIAIVVVFSLLINT